MNGPSVRENSHARNAVAISATPPASPSMLSRRFSACTTPPNQTTASSVTGHGRLRPRDSVMKNTVSAPTMREADELRERRQLQAVINHADDEHGSG